jgi:flavin reductase (DIM6/NTAB) family NADH-FMN oxidoreductase RutF
METTDELKKTVGKALGRIPSGIFIVTAGQGEGAVAMMASWVQQAGFKPPCVSVAVGTDRPALDVIRREGMFGVSVLGEADRPIFKTYARGVGMGAAAFPGIKTRQGASGVVLLDEALAVLECRLKSVCEFAGDHVLLIGEVTAGEMLKEGEPFKHVRGNGFHY